MNNNLRSMNMDANPSKSDLLRELGIETETALRQELLEAIWRLDRQATLRFGRRRQSSSSFGRKTTGSQPVLCLNEKYETPSKNK